MPIENLQTPVGRLVWGNPARSNTKKDQRTKLPVIKDGKEVQQWAFGIAFQKHEFDQFIRPALEQEARTAYPHGFPPTFSWKYKDGDGVDRAGKPYAQREGYAGHYILNISTEAFAPPIYKFENNAYRQVAPEEIKTGYYFALNLNVKVNVPTDPSHTPGLYINPNGLEFVAYGPEIHNSVSPDELFGGRQHQLPPGASAVPLAASTGVGMPIPSAAPAPQGYPPQAAPQGYPQQMAPAPAQYQPPAQPAYQPQQAAPAPQGYPNQPPVQPYQQPVQQHPAPAPDFITNAGYAGPAAAPTAGYVPPAMPSPINQGAPQGYPQMQGVPQSR